MNYINLDEVYIGKTKELLEMERLIGKVRDLYSSSVIKTPYIASVSVNGTKEMQAFNRAMEDFFGFKTFALTIEPSKLVNAYTLPISYSVDLAPQFRVKNNLVANSNGFKYKKEAGYVCGVCMFGGMFFDKERFSNAEILAMILHEIGHNFQSVLTDRMYYLSDVCLLLQYINIFIQSLGPNMNVANAAFNVVYNLAATSNIVKYVDTKITNFVAQSPALGPLVGTFKAINGAFNDIKYDILTLIGHIIKYGCLPSIVVDQILRRVTHPLGKEQENISDSFAAMYGYGTELSSALSKVSKGSVGIGIDDAIYSIPLISELFMIYNLPYEIIITALDEHPSGIDRTALIKNNLENELRKGDYDPKMRREISEQIRQLDRDLDDYRDYSNKFDRNSLQIAWNVFIYDTMGNKGVSNTSKRLTSNIDKSFAAAKLRMK
jgi:hypothetical protein